ncbi:23S rRNA (adenine(2030)-N(6))-methyltransferase RlmJ [Pseudomonas sp. F1_0610]|uniref:23S rRNA (adenine(2030)-N(6))-methyltransferase RlmJ n=1 Tax=Pseudomonas sp. F1_0610 TaxID=3114284 RepID=UPI0039C2D907
MNYRHAFHAGNHADVFKHSVLVYCFELMAHKEAPIAYLDSHSGIGLYDLHGSEAGRTGEYLQGIQRIWQSDDTPASMQGYLQLIKQMQPETELRFYPGSPEVARSLSRAQDRLQLNEMHPEDSVKLKGNMRLDRRVTVHQGDGWHTPKALLPTQQKRLLMLIDPPFEKEDELKRCVQALQEAVQRMRQAVVIIWYPVKDQKQLKHFYKALEKSGVPKLLLAELFVHQPDDASRLTGSGLAICNAPWGLEQELKQLLPWLAEKLAQTKGSYNLKWLIADN